MREGKASTTAKMVAFWRTLADRGATNVPGFADPIAHELIDGRAWRWMLARAERMTRGEGRQKLARQIDGLILRVAFIDAEITAAAPKQLVILGAGLDTRAWRLDALRGARVFEVDHPATQSYKRARAQRLGPPFAALTYVPTDFTTDDLRTNLRAAGFDPRVPAVWVWEGVTMYLDDTALRTTLAQIRELFAPGSLLLAHYHEPDPPDHHPRARAFVFRWLGEPQNGLRDRAVMRREIEQAGFTVAEDAGLDEQAARVGAPPPVDAKLRVSRIVVAR